MEYLFPDYIRLSLRGKPILKFFVGLCGDIHIQNFGALLPAAR
jgi:uncharacterized protein (DUF2252 family)